MPLVHDEACKVQCTCSADSEVILPDGRVNLGAFTAHVFCIRCRALVNVFDIDDNDIEIDGGDISVMWHGQCPACGLMFNLEVVATEVDAPPQDPDQQVREETEAERMAKWNSRGRKL